MAIFFGSISPKTRIRSVMAHVAYHNQALQYLMVAILVTMAVAAIFATFVPINITMIRRSVFSRSRITA